MNKQTKLSDIKGLSFIGGQITSRIEADEKKNERRWTNAERKRTKIFWRRGEERNGADGKEESNSRFKG